ncbi:aminoacylase-1-like [Octopus sinensis]|uniref:Aminoacylase-1-like n=1 Tax=Octopus sinensis TaxID=2607531 RepID=A0A6P7U491_9MOLL|nr:aminoacylase-1-like [Octopus sinensis]
MVDAFREYLRFPTVQPDPDYGPAVKFLSDLAFGIGLQPTVLELHPTKLILVIKWEGNDPEAESILLNSHMDVVPVYKEKWTFDPFSAEMDNDGNIYARGSQDFTDVRYLEAIRNLIKEGYVPRRTIYVSVVPDPALTLGDVTTINLTVLEGGVQTNVVPATLSEPMEDIFAEYMVKSNNKQAGLPVLGFSPMNNTPVLLHDHDEYLNVDTFLRGIDIYQIILQKIST